MEESEYKTTYNELAQIPCVFEKALMNQKVKCRLARHFYLADREGYACQSVSQFKGRKSLGKNPPT